MYASLMRYLDSNGARVPFTPMDSDQLLGEFHVPSQYVEIFSGEDKDPVNGIKQGS